MRSLSIVSTLESYQRQNVSCVNYLQLINWKELQFTGIPREQRVNSIDTTN